MKDRVTVSHTRTHARTRTHTRARTHARTHIHTHTQHSTRTHTHTQHSAHTHAHNTQIHTRAHARTHTRPRVCGFALRRTLDLCDVFPKGAVREGPRQRFGRVESSQEKVMILERRRGRRLLSKTYRPGLSYVRVDLSAPS